MSEDIIRIEPPKVDNEIGARSGPTFCLPHSWKFVRTGNGGGYDAPFDEYMGVWTCPDGAEYQITIRGVWTKDLEDWLGGNRRAAARDRK